MGSKHKVFFTNITLVTLLLIRYFSEAVFAKISDERIFTLARFVNLTIVFTLIMLVLWANIYKLHELNIDKTALWVLIFSAGLLAFRYVPYFFGILIVGGIAILLYSLYKNNIHYHKSELLSLQSLLLTLCISIPLAPVLYNLYAGEKNSLTFTKVEQAVTDLNFFGVLFEEFLFRGLIWMFLKNRGMSERNLIVIQGILFWLAHYYSTSGFWYSIWVCIPFVSILLGLLVYRTKSITASLLAHSYYNFLVGLL